MNSAAERFLSTCSATSVITLPLLIFWLHLILNLYYECFYCPSIQNVVCHLPHVIQTNVVGQRVEMGDMEKAVRAHSKVNCELHCFKRYTVCEGIDMTVANVDQA